MTRHVPRRKPPSGMTLLGCYPVLELCADDLFRDPGTGRYAYFVESDHDGGKWVVIAGRDYATNERITATIRTTVRLNVWVGAADHTFSEG